MTSLFESELANWAVVSYKDATGLGRMAEDARHVLGIGNQIVIPSRRLVNQPLGPGDFLLSDVHSDDHLRDFLNELDGIIVFEKADWTATLLPIAKELGLAVAVVPMWEWFRADDPLWSHCDLFICPNQKCFEIVAGAGFENVTILPWALNLSRFPQRNISGPARRFIHNAGLVDHDDRKGTIDAIEAFKRVNAPDARLIVRIQSSALLPKLDPRIEIRVGSLFEPGDLWAEGDVAIQPSKMEGIGFMVLEPICSGVPVITLDAAPMNEYGAELLVKPSWFKRKAFSSQWVPHARLHLPSQAHLTELIEHCTRTDLRGVSLRERAWAEETFNAENLREQWSRALNSIQRRRCKCVLA